MRVQVPIGRGLLVAANSRKTKREPSGRTWKQAGFTVLFLHSTSGARLLAHIPTSRKVLS